MRFSIIVVSLNAGEELRKTVESILMQTYKDFEILVKDGMSEDGSVENLPADDRIRLIRKKDRSIYDAMNQAVREAAGDYEIFLNCGDYFYDEKVLARIAKEIAGNPADIYYGKLFRRIQQTVDEPAHKITDFVCYRNIPCHQACVYGRKMFLQRGYDLHYPVRADYEHFLWCRYEGHAVFHYMPFVIASYEGSGFSETKDNLKRAAGEHKLITKKYLGIKCVLYRGIMLITLQPLRKRIADNPHLSKGYQRLKSLLYRR